MSKIFEVRVGIDIPEFDLGGIQTSYKIDAANLTDAEIKARKMFKMYFPLLTMGKPIKSYTFKIITNEPL